jgi:hypothetical protein
MSRTGPSLLISRRGLFPLAGGAVAASLSPGWLDRALAAETGGSPGAPLGALKRFDPPAMIRDLADQPAKQLRLDREWHVNANGWTEQATLGDPWTSLFAAHLDAYFNPLRTDISDAIVYQISWTGFPNRIAHYFSGLTREQRWQLAETGTLDGDAGGEPTIYAADVECGALDGKPGTLKRLAFPPYGYRGWLDEYCEMAVRRDGHGKLERIDLTCESPEYWYTLWRIDRERALDVYRQVLGPQVKMEELELRVGGHVVIDPSTGEPAYNPLNVWNRGTAMDDAGGGAMHLTSTPNTLKIELALAAWVTGQRWQGNANASTFVCATEFGQIYRNSDPHIAQVANQIVGLGYRVSLANPIGLYLQRPDFRSWKLPDDPNLPPGAKPDDLYRVIRGRDTLAGFPDTNNFIVHARLEIPAAWERAKVSFGLGDVTINGNALNWGSQVLETLNMALFVTAIPAEAPVAKRRRVVSLPQGDIKASASPQQLLFENLWDAYFGSKYAVPNRPGIEMNLASNTIIVAPRVRRGWKGGLVLTGRAFVKGDDGALPAVAFVDPATGKVDSAITVEVRAFEEVKYAVPGDTLPSSQQLLRMTVAISEDATLGQRDMRVANPGQAPAEAAKFLLWVEEQG